MLYISTVLINSGEWYKEREFPIRLQSCIRRGGDYDGDRNRDPDPYFRRIGVWQGGGVRGVNCGRMVVVGLFEGEDEEEEEEEDIRGDLEQDQNCNHKDREMGIDDSVNSDGYLRSDDAVVRRTIGNVITRERLIVVVMVVLLASQKKQKENVVLVLVRGGSAALQSHLSSIRYLSISFYPT